jgi:hypothetical protein
MNSSRKFPWLSGLIAAAVGATVLLVRVGIGVVNVLGDLMWTPPPM